MGAQAHVDLLPKIYLEDQITGFNSHSLKNFCNKLETIIKGKHLENINFSKEDVIGRTFLGLLNLQ